MAKPDAIDAIMESASQALEATSYFEVERLCIQAMGLARRVSDFDRMARIVLPLQEARRQRRHMALDAGFSIVVTELPERGQVFQPGCYLLKPPLIAADARMFREAIFEQNVPAVILTREPRTSSGRWPVVAVTSDRSFRAQIEPPKVDGIELADDVGPDAGWFMRAVEMVGDAGIAKLKPSDPAVFRVDDLWEMMQALPEHEKMAQRFAEECRLAKTEPKPDKLRRRGLFEDLGGF